MGYSSAKILILAFFKELLGYFCEDHLVALTLAFSFVYLSLLIQRHVHSNEFLIGQPIRTF